MSIEVSYKDINSSYILLKIGLDIANCPLAG